MDSEEERTRSASTAAAARVSTLGPAGTYSHQASLRYFGKDANISLERTIQDAFKAVESGTSRYAVCPIENSTNGPVRETHDCLGIYTIVELGRVVLDVGHALMRAKHAGSIPVELIYSHEQALGQCKRYLADHYPHATIHAVDSTARAAELAKSEPKSIAVASLMCATVYDLDVVDTDIQDGEANRTTFMAFEKASAK